MSDKHRILFVCHGNICRSPMAEFIFLDMLKKQGLESCFSVASAATSTEELGNGLYPNAKRCLNMHAVPYAAHCARQIRKSDYAEFDLIIGMDEENMYNLRRFFSPDPEGKLKSLMSFAGSERSVSDPWYTRDFEAAYNDIREGCEALLQHLIKKS